MAKLKVTDLTGPEGLVVAIVARAIQDATGRSRSARADAWAYLAGPVYRRHLDWLGVHPDTIPQVIREQARGGKLGKWLTSDREREATMEKANDEKQVGVLANCER